MKSLDQTKALKIINEGKNLKKRDQVVISMRCFFLIELEQGTNIRFYVKLSDGYLWNIKAGLQ